MKARMQWVLSTTTPSCFIVFLVLLLGYAATSCMAASIEIDPQGQQHDDTSHRGGPRQIQATFVNALPATTVNLYWAGNENSLNEGSLQLYYGPLMPNGGEKMIDGYEGMIFVLTKVGAYERLGEYRLGGINATSPSSAGKEKYVVTEENANEFRSRFPPQSIDSTRREDNAQRCRSINNVALDNWGVFLDRCQRCVKVNGCGFSPVRDRQRGNEGTGIGGCYASHTVATINNADECKELDAMEEARKVSVEAWLNRATELTLSGVEHRNGSRALRMAYRCLERAVEKSDQMVMEAYGKKDVSLIKAAEMMDRKATASLLELTAKLEAVFDDLDMIDLLESSRHPKLAETHPTMPVVPRRTVEEAKEYILRGEPVIITSVSSSDMPNPVSCKWTLEYLNQRVFGASVDGESPKFNVAADVNTRCCRYFEPQGKAQRLEYPYPFAPTTHLWYDVLGNFDETISNDMKTFNADTHSPMPINVSQISTLFTIKIFLQGPDVPSSTRSIPFFLK